MSSYIEYTVEDYNVNVFRGHVREDGRILHGIRSDGVLEWRLPNAFKSHENKRKMRNAQKNKQRKRWINKYKQHHGCSVCGVKDVNPRQLHFDHIDPLTKHDNVSNMVTGNLKKLIREIRKCRVICFECHVDHTAEQNRTGTYNAKEYSNVLAN